MHRRKKAMLLGLGLLSAAVTNSGEIAGTPAQMPPLIERDLELNFSNDFLGRGGSVDDFRTQQIILTARFAENWIALLDHSILTRDNALEQGRLDQLSGAVGYRLIHESDPDKVNSLTLGGGFRSSGEFAGERIQNGFHRLIGSDVEVLPYVDTNRTDATLWLDAERYRVLRAASGNSFFASWTGGYWIRGNTLLTTDGQWDTGLGAYAVASRNAIDIWFGLRQDWRSGYERDPVQTATAIAEQDLAVVLGVRFGAIVLETVQQTTNKASYGQLKFVSSGKNAFPQDATWPRINIEFGFILPDVQVQLAGKYRSNLLVSGDSRWRESLFLDTRFGEPQFGADSSVFVRSRQMTVGLEWERQLAQSLPWISVYGALGGGWRSEQLVGDNVRAGQVSESAGRLVVSGSSGLRFSAANVGHDWWYRLQLGIVAWAPLEDATVLLGNDVFRIQKPALGISLGMTFEYR